MENGPLPKIPQPRRSSEFEHLLATLTLSVINPTTGKVITSIPEGTAADVDIAVKAAQKAFNTTWGLNTPGFARGKILIKIAELIERDLDILSSIEALDNGKTFGAAKGFDVAESAACFRYYGGWADKIHGKTIEVGLDNTPSRSSLIV